MSYIKPYDNSEIITTLISAVVNIKQWQDLACRYDKTQFMDYINDNSSDNLMLLKNYLNKKGIRVENQAIINAYRTAAREFADHHYSTQRPASLKYKIKHSSLN